MNYVARPCYRHQKTQGSFHPFIVLKEEGAFFLSQVLFIGKYGSNVDCVLGLGLSEVVGAAVPEREP